MGPLAGAHMEHLDAPRSDIRTASRPGSCNRPPLFSPAQRRVSLVGTPKCGDPSVPTRYARNTKSAVSLLGTLVDGNALTAIPHTLRQVSLVGTLLSGGLLFVGRTMFSRCAGRRVSLVGTLPGSGLLSVPHNITPRVSLVGTPANGGLMRQSGSVPSRDTRKPDLLNSRPRRRPSGLAECGGGMSTRCARPNTSATLNPPGEKPGVLLYGGLK